MEVIPAPRKNLVALASALSALRSAGTASAFDDLALVEPEGAEPEEDSAGGEPEMDEEVERRAARGAAPRHCDNPRI